MNKPFDPTRVDELAKKLRERNSETATYVASQLKPIFQSEVARRPRQDALQTIIIDIVRQNPCISAKALRNELEARARPNGVVRAITADDMIEWVTNKGILESSPVSGLKDRLTKAKAALKKNSR